MTSNPLPQLNARVQSLAAPGSPFELERREHTTRGLHGGPRGVRSDSGDGLSVVSLFAGIGGFDLGCTQAGMRVVAHVEKDPHCRKLLADKFPGAEVLDDVCTAGAHNLPTPDVLAGGWPCQDLSQAGRRAGLAGARSGLFYQFTRIAHELQPRIILWENVPGLLNSDDGRDMLRVVAEFQRIGYCGGWRTLDAQFLGVAQRRRRVIGVFALANLGAGCCAEILSLHEGVRGHPAPRREAGKDVAGTLGGSSQSGGFRTTDLDNNGAFVTTLAIRGRGDGRNLETREDGTANAVLTPNGGRDGIGCGAIAMGFPARMSGTQCASAEDLSPVLQSHNPTAVAFYQDSEYGVKQYDTAGTLRAGREPHHQMPVIGSAVRRLTPRECERLQGFPDDWTAGFADSTRYRMLGNAVAVPVARWIAARICATVAGLRGGSAWEQTGGKAELSRAKAQNA